MKNCLLALMIIAFHAARLSCQILPYYITKSSSSGTKMVGLNGNVAKLNQEAFLAEEKDGKIISGGQRSTDLQCSTESTFTMSFDTLNRLQETHFSNCSGLSEVMVRHSYNTQGTVETVSHIEDGRIYCSVVYKYNAKGNPIDVQYKQLFRDGADYTSRTTFTYDTKNRLVKSVIENPGNQPGVNTFIYDQNNGLIQKDTKMNGQNLNYKETYVLDTKGQRIETVFYAVGGTTIDHRFVFKYDENGNVIKKDYYLPADKLLKSWTYTYEFDAKKNWVKRYDRENGKPTCVLIRKLTYY
jgi:hypothetical protein